VDQVKRGRFHRVENFETESGIVTKGVYSPEDIHEVSFERDIGFPGQYPFTRGHHPEMYRGKLWHIGQLSGISPPARFNERLKFMLKEGNTALRWQCDGALRYGIEPDQTYAEGGLGVSGGAAHTLGDVEKIIKDLPLEDVSFAQDGPLPDTGQAIILAAKRAGYDPKKLRGINGAGHYFNAVICPRLNHTLHVNGQFSTLARWGNDFCEYVLRNMPRWMLWFISAHGVRETGINAIQEVAFTIAARNELVREMLKRGLDIDTVGRQICLTFGSGIDLFEEVAKFRAARRIWARTMKEEFGATDPAAICLRFSVNGLGSYYTQQQPLVNIVRGAIECLAAILGGTTDIQNPPFDEGLAIPTEESVRMAIRTQQVLAYESGAARVADPLGGSYYVEWLTSKIEREVEQLVNDIEARGGWLAAVASGWVYQESQKGLLEIQRKISAEEKIVVGVNRFTIPPDEDYRPDIYAPDQAEVEAYIAEFREFKRRRDNKRLEQALKALYRAASQTSDNLVPYVFNALEADATFAEIIGTLRIECE